MTAFDQLGTVRRPTPPASLDGAEAAQQRDAIATFASPSEAASALSTSDQ